jgi:hypothetical protein
MSRCWPSVGRFHSVVPVRIIVAVFILFAILYGWFYELKVQHIVGANELLDQECILAYGVPMVFCFAGRVVCRGQVRVGGAHRYTSVLVAED